MFIVVPIITQFVESLYCNFILIVGLRSERLAPDLISYSSAISAATPTTTTIIIIITTTITDTTITTTTIITTTITNTIITITINHAITAIASGRMVVTTRMRMKTIDIFFYF